MLGDRIREVRNAAHESQEKMGERIGYSQRAIASYENGDRQPRLEVLEKIADTYGVSMDYLFGRTDIPNIYAHQIETADGKKSEFWDTQKELSAAEKERMSQIAASAAVPNNMEELVSVIEIVVNKVLDERKK